MAYTAAQKRAIKDALAAFDGDVLAAQKALSLLHVTGKKKNIARDLGEEIIAVSGVKKTYKIGKNTVQALNGVDVSIRAGEFVAILARAAVVKVRFYTLWRGSTSRVLA